MTSKQHLQIINPVHRDSRSFPSFALLPTELRLDIWQLSLQRSRLLNIRLGPSRYRHGQVGGETSRYNTTNDLGRVVSDAECHVTVGGTQLLSKLLRVNSEARRAALQFYRVHLPCYFESGDNRHECITLPFNPELDILHVQRIGEGHSFVDLLHDLRAYDHLGVGLLNLALDHNGVAGLLDERLSDLEPAPRVAFTDALASLRQVFFVCLENAGRIYLGPRGGIHTVRGYEIHRSRPIMSAIPTFERMVSDPRGGMTRDLSRVFVGTFDPRQMLCRWRVFLDRWQIVHTSSTKAPEYRFLVSTNWGTEGRAWSQRIVDRESAAAWLRLEDERWARGQERNAAAILRRGGKVPVESAEELEHVPRPAIGFWLFPIEALGPVPGPEGLASAHDGAGNVWVSKRVVDMRNHWPELCLASMP